MKEMLKVFETNDGSKAVSARELHERLTIRNVWDLEAVTYPHTLK
jgi:hypothetical protein